ncbi:MAG: DUF167 domain-containing protein [Desulfobacterales bacterium]|jgi:hypothetical protein
MPYLKENADGVTLTVFVQPRSSKNMITGLHNHALKIKLTSPPVDDAANKMCIQYLAKCLKIPKSSIEIISGHKIRTKRLRLKHQNEKNPAETESARIRSLISSLIR